MQIQVFNNMWKEVQSFRSIHSTLVKCQGNNAIEMKQTRTKQRNKNDHSKIQWNRVTKTMLKWASTMSTRQFNQMISD